MNTRAQWAEDVPDLSGDLKKAANYLNLSQVSEKTGLSPNTLKDALSRPPVTREGNPMRELSRPDARISNLPLYSKEQVRRAIALQAAAARVASGETVRLPLVTAEEARRAGLAGPIELADYADVHEQTIRRWARDVEDFPPIVADRERSEGHPGGGIKVREMLAFKEWLRDYIESNTGTRVERIAAHLRKAHKWRVTAGSALQRKAG
jgi:hypothetical protein